MKKWLVIGSLVAVSLSQMALADSGPGQGGTGRGEKAPPREQVEKKTRENVKPEPKKEREVRALCGESRGQGGNG